MFDELEEMVSKRYPHDQILEDTAKWEWASDIIEAVQSGEIDPDRCSDFAINSALAEVEQFEPAELENVQRALCS